MARYHEHVPAEPFARWLQQRYDFYARQQEAIGLHLRANNKDAGPCILLAKEIGWYFRYSRYAAVRKVYRYRHCVADGKRRVNGRMVGFTYRATTFPRAVVEDALHHAGLMFEDLYPDLAAAEDIPLEPAMLCWTCKDVVTPVLGVCPWCETELAYQDEDAWAA